MPIGIALTEVLEHKASITSPIIVDNRRYTQNRAIEETEVFRKDKALMKNLRILICCGLVFGIGTCDAQVRKNSSGQQSCQSFVQTFYDWYLQVAGNQLKEGPLEYALKHRRRAFSPKLIDRLREEAETLDLDPLVNSQDPGERFVVGGVTLKGTSCRAEVYEIRDGKRSDKPQIVADLVRRGHTWVFIDL